MTEKLLALVKAIGLSDTTLQSITEETTQEQLDDIVQSFIENQKAMYKGKDVNVDDIKKGSIAEGKRKTRKAIREALGLTAELTNAQIDEMDDAGFSTFIKEKSQASSTQEVSTLRTQLTQLGQQVEQLTEEKETEVNNVKSEYEKKINSIYVSGEIKEQVNKFKYVVTEDEAILMLEAKLAKKGISIKKTESGIELLNDKNERVQKINDKGIPVGFHTLETFVDSELDTIKIKNNGGASPNGNEPFVRPKKDMSQAELAMLASLEAME